MSFQFCIFDTHCSDWKFQGLQFIIEETLQSLTKLEPQNLSLKQKVNFMPFLSDYPPRLKSPTINFEPQELHPIVAGSASSHDGSFAFSLFISSRLLILGFSGGP